MAKHYYSIEVASTVDLEDVDVEEIENQIKAVVASMGGTARVTTEYVDSEG